MNSKELIRATLKDVLAKDLSHGVNISLFQFLKDKEDRPSLSDLQSHPGLLARVLGLFIQLTLEDFSETASSILIVRSEKTNLNALKEMYMEVLSDIDMEEIWTNLLKESNNARPADPQKPIS